MEIGAVKKLTDTIITNIGTVILGKEEQVRLVIAALLADGHVLLEDVPGTGKTNLAKAIAKCFDCEFGRIQFTPDLLPSELTGINFYNPKSGEFSFRKGSLFSNIVLADEINRATPRTQSGLLESMEERQVTVDGETRKLEPPYFVIATQNPVETHGTFPLPEAQLDRFLIKISLGYPERSETINIIKNQTSKTASPSITPVCSKNDLTQMQELAKTIYIHDDICGYIVDICHASRKHDSVLLGVSTRGIIAITKISQAYALLSGRDYVIPEDIKYLVPHVFGHRLMLRGRTAQMQPVLADIIESVSAPTEDWKEKKNK